MRPWADRKCAFHKSKDTNCLLYWDMCKAISSILTPTLQNAENKYNPMKTKNLKYEIYCPKEIKVEKYCKIRLNTKYKSQSVQITFLFSFLFRFTFVFI